MPRGNIGHCTVRCTYKKRTSCCVDLMKFIVNKYNTDRNWFFDPGTQYTYTQVYQERRSIVWLFQSLDRRKWLSDFSMGRRRFDYRNEMVDLFNHPCKMGDHVTPYSKVSPQVQTPSRMDEWSGPFFWKKPYHVISCVSKGDSGED